MESTTAETSPAIAAVTPTAAGLRKNGKNWHTPRKAFRPTAGQTSYAKRAARTAQMAQAKKIESEMRVEREEEREV